MAYIAQCWACEKGDHHACLGDHPAPEGMKGGSYCNCECRTKEVKPEPKKPCEHKHREHVGLSGEGAGTIDVEWCPDCGALKRTMTNWKYTDYPWRHPRAK